MKDFNILMCFNLKIIKKRILQFKNYQKANPIFASNFCIIYIYIYIYRERERGRDR